MGKIKFFLGNREYILLGLILLLGLFVRVYRLSEVPSGFFCDETSRGVEAYWLLNKGVDTHGESWPLFFKAVGASIPPLQFYSTIPLVALLGLNEMAVRLTSVIWGLISIMGMYLLGKEIGKVQAKSEKRKNKETGVSNLGLWAALILAIEPWALHYSRTGFEYTAYMALYVWGWWSWLKTRRDGRWWAVFGIIWGTALYTYVVAYITVPLTVGLLIFISLKNVFRKGDWKKTVMGIGFFVLLMIPIEKHLLFGQGLERWNQVSGASNRVFSQRLEQFVGQYMHQLSFSYFWIDGEDTFITRHFTKGLVPLLWIQAPLILIGLGWVLENFRRRGWLLIWLVIYPVAGALANNGPFTNRSIIGAPLMALLTGVGIVFVISKIKYPFNSASRKKLKILRRLATLFVVLGFGWSFMGWWRFYMDTYPLRSEDFWGWQYGPREIMSYFKEQSGNYDELIMSHEFNAPNIFIRFYDPEGKCRGCMIGDAKRFNPRVKQLFALSGKQLLEAAKSGLVMEVQREVVYPNGEIAFRIGELQRR